MSSEDVKLKILDIFVSSPEKRKTWGCVCIVAPGGTPVKKWIDQGTLGKIGEGFRMRRVEMENNHHDCNCLHLQHQLIPPDEQDVRQETVEERKSLPQLDDVQQRAMMLLELWVCGNESNWRSGILSIMWIVMSTSLTLQMLVIEMYEGLLLKYTLSPRLQN